MKKILFILFHLLVSIVACAQNDNSLDPDTTSIKKKRGDEFFKGLVLQYGTSYLNTDDSKFNVRTGIPSVFSIYLNKLVPLVKHNLTFLVGIGLSNEGYNFEKRNLRIDPVNPRNAYLDSTGSRGYNRSRLTTNFIDVPVEFQYASSPHLKKSFKFALGARAGLLTASNTKVKYTENNKDATIKSSDHSAQRFRYGLTARIGIGGISLYTYYGLSSIFKEKYQKEATPIIFGISVTSF
jgi:hypothetical protein